MDKTGFSTRINLLQITFERNTAIARKNNKCKRYFFVSDNKTEKVYSFEFFRQGSKQRDEPDVPVFNTYLVAWSLVLLVLKYIAI